jgi:3-oxoacyl-[acyl-carrier protein] reductase
VFEINVLGAYLYCRAVLGEMVEGRHGRIDNVGSGAGYLPVRRDAGGTAYGPSKAALYRFGEILAGQLRQYGVSVFTISPGLVRSAMTEELGDDAPWTPSELAPRLIRALASGRADRLSGRYIHAEHDDIEDLIARADEIIKNDSNSIRLVAEAAMSPLLLSRESRSARGSGTLPRRCRSGPWLGRVLDSARIGCRVATSVI